MKVIVGLAFGLALLWSTSASAIEIEKPAPDSPQITLAASIQEALPFREILHMEPNHLIVVTAGVVTGAAFIGPFLGVSELLGIGLGFVAGELIYRSSLWPFHKEWFE